MQGKLHILIFVLFCLPISMKAQQTTIKTNALFWATTSPNAGVEFGITRRITVDIWGAYNAWKFSNEMKLNLYLLQPEKIMYCAATSTGAASPTATIGRWANGGAWKP